MSALTELVEGWSGALPFTLNADGLPVDLTGMTVFLVLKDCEGTTIKDTTAGITLTLSTGGQLEYAPSTSTGDLFLAARTPYTIRFRVKDALSKVVYFPNGDADLITVNVI